MNLDFKKFMQGPAKYLLLIVVAVLLITLIGSNTQQQSREIAYSELLQNISDDKVASIATTGNTLVARMRDSAIREEDFPRRFDVRTLLPSMEQFYRNVNSIYSGQLNKPVDAISTTDYRFTVHVEPIPQPAWWLEFIPFLVMTVLMVGLLWFLMRQQSGGNKSVMNFGRSRAKLTDPEKNRVTFSNVAGADEEKEELREIVEFLKNPQRFVSLGARIPKGVLLVGPPGTGKTLLARAVAGEAGVPFFIISGSDFVEMFVGVGASRVRDLFDQAKRHSPSILFIDEIDAVGRHRGAGLGGGHDEREQTLNQLLVEMDGFSANEGVIVLAATNRSDILDPALLRPGRFDRQITVGYPDIKGREEILQLHSRGKPIATDVDLHVIAQRTPYFTGADLENVLNEAAILTARGSGAEIHMPEIEEAITRVHIGPEKKSRVVTPRDRKLVAFHEAGHAIVAHFIPECDEVHEVSVIPRGPAGGYTMSLPNDEVNYITKAKMQGEIACSLGGHCAEKLIFGDTSTGSTSDLKHATDIARRMITEYGMSEELGPMFLGGGQEVFLGRDLQQSRNYSEKVAAMIDHEMSHIIEQGYSRAEQILTEKRSILDKLAETLIEREKLDRAQFLALVGEIQPEPIA